MASNYTEHLGLTLWNPKDSVLRTEFNENNRKLDAALATILRTESGTYVGTGAYGASSPNQLTFSFQPLMVVITANNASVNQNGTVLIRNQTRSAGFGGGYTLSLVVSWTGNSVSWHHSGEINAAYQLNANGMTYHYFAIGV